MNSKARKGSNVPTCWPVVGMLPTLISKVSSVHNSMTEILAECGGTFQFKGPVFTDSMNMMITCDPANINYILTKNFSNFSKGPEFIEIFDALGDGIFNAESESWENQRRIVKSTISHAGFLEFVATTSWKKLETGLIPILEHVLNMGIEVDLQGLLQRFTFDCTCIFILGHDPVSLCQELPHLPHEKAFMDAEEAILYRHVLPKAVRKMQKWLQIGREKKLTQAMDNINRFLSSCIEQKQRDMNLVEGSSSPDLLTSCIKACTEKGIPNISEKVMKDLMLNLIFAGKDTISATLSWFFWLLAKNRDEAEKIRDEIAKNSEEPGNWKFSDMDALNKLTYLHGSLCEALRLFPAVAIQHKAPLKHDILPSGHLIKPNTKTLLAFYSMGRMESIWGKDCLDFKPGRWISPETGRIKVEPSYKFTAFNAGPRSCQGREVSFIQMKITVAALVSRFILDVVPGHPVQPSISVVLHMKHGLNVNVSRHAKYN